MVRITKAATLRRMLETGTVVTALALGFSLAPAEAQAAAPPAPKAPTTATAVSNRAPTALPTKRLRATKVSIARSAASYRYGATPITLTIRARAQGRAGTGKVTVKVGAKSHVLKLRKGKAFLTMPRYQAPGTHAISARYRPSSKHRAATARTSARVTLGATTLKLAPTTISFRGDQKPPSVTMTATAAGKPGSGKVTIAIAGQRFSPLLKSGKLAFAIPSGLKPGSHVLTASYRKTSRYQLVTKSLTVRVMAPPAKQPSSKSLMKSAWNFRDLAGPDALGYATSDHKHVTKGAFYRSNVLALSDDDATVFQNLGIKTIYDLRRPTETPPDRTMPGVTRVNIDIYSNGTTTGTMADVYKGFVNDPVYRGQFATALKAMAANDAPLVFHCAAGKDRTGWMAALLLSLAKVPRKTITEDYLASNEYLNGTLSPGQAGYRTQVEKSWLDGAFAELDKYGTTESYVVNVLGLSQSEVDELKGRLAS